MISRRLTKAQKTEILEAYRSGDNTNAIAEKYGCTTNTINRTVKTLLSDSEYTNLKNKRSKTSNKKRELINNDILNEKVKSLEQSNSLISLKEKGKEEEKFEETNEDLHRPELDSMAFLSVDNKDDFVGKINSDSKNHNHHGIDNNHQNSDNEFEEIVPLISNFDFELEKQKQDFQILNYEILPECAYMIVDKKVELDLQPISDLPEWSFLPENELKRNAILLFSNQRSAKRSCSRNQRVIKIPNTSILKTYKTYLLDKGITRLILEDSLIAL